MQRLFFATIALIFATFPAQAEVRCETVSNPPVAERKDGFMLLTVQRPALQKFEGQYGFVMVEIFGLDADKARSTGDPNFQSVEACDIHSRFHTLRYKVRAFPEVDHQGNRMHLADVPVPDDLKDATVRWCSAAEKRCLESKFDSKDGSVYLETVAGAKAQRSQLR